MKNYSQEESDQDSSTKAQLYIYIDSETNAIGFGSDWEETIDGIDGIAEIFFKLRHDGLIEQILSVLYKQCVVEDRADVFNKILNKIHSKTLNNTEPDELVVRPTQQGASHV